MESQTHSLANLFAQLGLPCEHGRHRQPSSSTHAPLPSRRAAGRTHRSGRLSQAAVSESRYFDEDADWSAVIDTLDARLRHRL
jgi:hypothetical protein